MEKLDIVVKTATILMHDEMLTCLSLYCIGYDG